MLRLALCAALIASFARAGAPSQQPHPINLATVLALADAAPLDIALAARRTEAAAADLSRARALWLPTVTTGVDYYRHDGQLQDIVGNVFTTSRSAVMAGVGPTMQFAFTDALYAPLAAKQELRARREEEQAARNDSAMAAALAFFEVQRARGEVAGGLEAVRKAGELVGRVSKLAPSIVPLVEASRARSELARRRLAVESAHERWQVQSAELARLLRLPPAALVVPTEPPELRVPLIDPALGMDELIPLAMANRPELAAYQAVVEAAQVRLRQERLRPFIPSFALRGAATNPGGTLSSGVFGGGVNSRLSDFTWRNSMDAQLTWQLQNLGFGNRAAVRRRQAESEIAAVQAARLQDGIAAEVAQAHARASRAEARLGIAAEALREAEDTAEKSLEGLGQTRRVGGLLQTVVRPQEAAAAIAALEQGYRDWYGAAADANRAQFQLYRALGQPAQALLAQVPPAPRGAVAGSAP
ncbi:MAG: TolC family protein [Gemmataceae bacterium]|nr:TolC family protein [Gemmataceae bacterium]